MGRKILLVTTDQPRYATLGCNGGTVARTPGAARLREHLIAAHTTTAEVGKVAAAAGVGTLVLNHLVPGDDPSLTDEMWRAEPAADFGGEVIVGQDLQVI